ncbi:UNKNOWN [Stylonychia lemnae]|uniref:Morn repeat protein n=1 Tax=Stylonychia lemnae TaxID=5949 RepID=A0A078AKA3_STYLE|nr:UNKNOWN [Stylonychia lemnae]|eukprot:CDW82815.1 UNKNOWN [Stylonychia lemnae]
MQPDYQLITSFDNDKGAFDLTIISTNALVNEIISKLGVFNYSSLDKIHPNPNRIFKPLIKYDNGTYQGEYDTVKKQKDGKGRFILQNGTVYDGFWKNDLKDGFGRFILYNGNYYISEWKNGKLNGYGKYYYINGKIYEGQFLNDKKEGIGLLTWHNGNQYYGQWVNGNRQGVGVYTFKSGDILLGQWMNNQLHGIVMVIPKNGGQIEIRRYQNYQLIQKLLKIDNAQK